MRLEPMNTHMVYYSGALTTVLHVSLQLVQNDSAQIPPGRELSKPADSTAVLPSNEVYGNNILL